MLDQSVRLACESLLLTSREICHMDLYALYRCPICRQRASSAPGCCQTCANEMCQPTVKGDLLYLGRYERQLEKAIRALKFHGATRLALFFAKQLTAAVEQAAWQPEAVRALPLHWQRYLQRGYNQAKSHRQTPCETLRNSV